MFDPIELGCEFFEGLTAVDGAIVERVAEEPCRDCGGPLHRGDYPRKPRGGLLAVWPRGSTAASAFAAAGMGAATGPRPRRSDSWADACTSGPW